jgi:hypothetical protein
VKSTVTVRVGAHFMEYCYPGLYVTIDREDRTIVLSGQDDTVEATIPWDDVHCVSFFPGGENGDQKSDES